MEIRARILRVVGVMREGVNEAHFNPLHSHLWRESGQVKSKQEKPNKDGSGERYWGSQLQRSTSNKLMKSYNVFMKGKKKMHPSRGTCYRSQLEVKEAP